MSGLCRSSIPPSPDHLLLASFTYDPSLATPMQTFPVAREIRELGVDVGIVIFKIASNWGADFTCLYRVSRGLVISDHVSSSALALSLARLPHSTWLGADACQVRVHGEVPPESAE